MVQRVGMKRILVSILFLVAITTTSSILAQSNPPTFQDLLDHLVGKWNATGIVHGTPSKQTFEADWVLNHQFLRIHEKSEENVRGTNVPFEALIFIGYDKANKRYILHSVSMFGAGRPGEFAYGQRIGNEIRFDVDIAGRRGHGRFIWQPESKTWTYLTGVENTKGELNSVDLKLTSADDRTEQVQASSKDEKAIKSLIIKRLESFNNKHDAPQSAAFTQDADFVNVYGMWRKGPAEIEGRQGERMKTVLKDAKITMQDLRIRFIRPDIAIVHETHEMSRMRNEKGETMPPQQELSIRVMVKEQRKWLITAFHNTIVRPAEPAPLSFDGPKSTADQAKIEEVKRAENERLAAGVKKDIDAVSAATADEYIQIDLDGRVLAKTTMLQRIQSSYAQLRSNPVDEMVVRVYGDTAVVTGRVTPQGTIGGQNVGGPVRYSRLYVKRDGRWQVVMFQQTRVAQEK